MKKLITLPGDSFPLGAILKEGGVNFSVYSPNATAVDLLLFEDEEDTSPTVISLHPEENKTYYYWHVFVPNLKENQLYGYRIDGPYNPEKGDLFDSSKILVDPYAKAIVGKYDRKLAHKRGVSNLHSCLKSGVINDDFDWESDLSPNQDISETIVYELHLSGFTKSPDSGVEDALKGTYRGLVEKIPHLKELGITAVELMPIYAFDEQDAPSGRTNYWGYSPINFFAPHTAYAQSKKPQEIVNEVKEMVKALHKANIEVYLDVVYNHTTENNAFKDGPTLCHRGFANHSYYMLDENGKFRNYTGTGNTVNANHSVVRRMIRHSLRYWVREMHIDGFRFDLASALSRSEEGNPEKNPPILWAIDSDPVLCKVKIIAEPWDAVGLHQVDNFAGDRWVIWNDKYRDSVRKFVKGDAGQVKDIAKNLMGNPFKFKGRHVPFTPERSLQFITCHDGFTLNDLVSYNEKHNWRNGEQNRDGSSNNLSWNCGIEGETESLEINQLREKQIKNLLSILFLSQGTPMLSMGDEVRRTQTGNNNAYCQDNELSWMNWNWTASQKRTLEFTKKIIKTGQQFKTFNHKNYYSTQYTNNAPYIDFYGTELEKPDWSFEARSLAIEITSPNYNEHIFIILNMFWEELEFKLPPDVIWTKVFDTDTDESGMQYTNSYKCPARTIAMFYEPSETFKST